jgi:3-deoxy-manno-octulosonate cytidylyltransferase (CMP-KDO synthetase)
MSTAAMPIACAEDLHNSSVVKCVFDRNGNVLYFSRLPVPWQRPGTSANLDQYYQHIGIYVFRPQFLLQYAALPPTPLQCAEDIEGLKVLEHGYRIKVAVVGDQGIGVNTPDDVIKLEKWLCKQNTSSLQGAFAPL